MAANLESGTSTPRLDWRGTRAVASYGVAFDALPGAMIALDGGGCIVAMTRRATQMFGHELDQMRDRALHHLLPELSLADLAEREGDTTGKHRAGECLPLHWEACPFDATTGVQVVLLHDLREVHALERELSRARTHVTRLQREFERFAYVASNDLQEPLRMVASFTDLLARRYRDRLDEQGQEFLHFAHDGARRMRILLNALFEYSRLGAEPVAMQMVDLSQIQHEAVRTLGLALKDAGGTVVAHALPVISGHRAHLRTLFYQLLSNAIRFGAPERPLRIEIAAARLDAAWQIIFTDNGLGIPVEYRPRVMAMFQRLPRDRRAPGAGMGLALCRKICELQGGSIEIQAQDPAGTRIIVTWPDTPH